MGRYSWSGMVVATLFKGNMFFDRIVVSSIIFFNTFVNVSSIKQSTPVNVHQFSVYVLIICTLKIASKYSRCTSLYEEIGLARELHQYCSRHNEGAGQLTETLSWQVLNIVSKRLP